MTIEFIRKSNIMIPWEVGGQYVKAIKEDLTRRSKNYQSDTYTTNTFYVETKDYLLVPRFFPIWRFIPGAKVVDKSSPGEKIKINHNITPRNDLQRRSIKYMMTHGSGIIQLEPGSGKTVISICIIAERKRKTLVLVHRDSLVQQWMDRVREFAIGGEVVRLTSSNYEEALTRPIIVTTNQTMISLIDKQPDKFLSHLYNSNIGIFIADEVHTTVGAPSFSQCSIHVPAKVIYGLSATPYRWDGNSDIINYHLGPTIEDDDDAGVMPPIINIILMDFGITQRSLRYIYWDGKFQRSRYLNQIRRSHICMKFLKSILEKYKQSRDIILVAERIKMIEQLYDWIETDSKAKFIQSAQNDVLSNRVVFATTGKIRDGVDIPQKDFLIMTSPVSNIAQMCGRITRVHPEKKTPIILDLVDIGCSDIRGTVHRRLEHYRKKNWDVNFMLATNDGKIRNLSTDEAMKVLRGA